ncbi:MAG: DUF6345 domain-containing protein, partial [Actinomycetia bacterium]|nr:DUF6345 domain-containing protein [Actinomycetes bacterium]
GITVYGSLNASGTPDQPIIFTSAYDTEGGQVIFDGLDHKASYTDWKGLDIYSDDVVLNNAYVGYGGGSSGALITVNGCSPTLKNLKVTNGTAALLLKDHERGGTGICFMGDCGTQITTDSSYNTRIRFCSIGVWVIFNQFARQSIFPRINNCDLHSCDAGVAVTTSMYNYPPYDGTEPIDATNNDWCDPDFYLTENGPAPAGDGSGVYNFDTVDVLPWKGLSLDQKQDDNDNSRPEVSIVYSETDIPDAKAACENLANVCAGDGIIIRQRKGNSDSGDVLRGGERDMREYKREEDPRECGQDPLSFDNVDLGMYAGHGWLVGSRESAQSVMAFDRIPYRTKRLLSSSEIAWGDQDLEWAIVYSCRFFARNSQVDTVDIDRGHKPGVPPEDEPYNPDDYSTAADADRRLRSHTINKGLHMVMGFGTREYMQGEMGQETAELFIGTEYPQKRIREAWFLAAYRNQPQDKRSEDQIWQQRSIWDPHNLAVAYGAQGYMDDFFWGKGPVAATDPGPGATPVFKTEVCDYEGGPSLTELPEETMTIIDPSGTYEADPGQTKVFQLDPPNSVPCFDVNGVTIRFREAGVTGVKQYHTKHWNGTDPNHLTIQIPLSLEPDREYQVLFLNHNMAFGYLVQNLHMRLEE